MEGWLYYSGGILNLIKQAYVRRPDLPNLLLDSHFTQSILTKEKAWRTVVMTAAQIGIPVPAFSASLDYFDSYRRDRLPQNLTQAQRDYFGAHTYERIDREGVFHTEWTK